MAKPKKKVKKKYVQRRIGIHPMFFVPENVADKVIGNRPLTPEELYRLRAPISLSYIAMCEGRGTPTDWYNLAFRIHAGKLMADGFYTDEIVQELQHAYDVLNEIRIRNESLQPDECDWNLIPEHRPIFLPLLDAIDQMQLEVDRAVQLSAYKQTLVFLEVFRDNSHELRKAA